MTDDASAKSNNAVAAHGMAPLLSVQQAAEVLNVSVDWVRKKATAREIPFTKIGRHIRFTPEHIAQIIAAGEQPVLNPPDPLAAVRLRLARQAGRRGRRPTGT